MDEDARRYQDQLHSTNEKRMDRIEKVLDHNHELMLRVVGNTDKLPALERRVEKLETDKTFRKGVIATVLFLGSMAGAGLGEAVKTLFHQLFSK